MDLNDFWQENKRLLVTVGCGLLVFLIGQFLVEGAYGTDLARAKADKRTNENRLREARYSQSDLDAAEDENEALRAALDTLAGAVEFRPRPEFVVDSAEGSASSQYFTRVEEVREELDLLAGRNRMAYPDGWGIEALDTNSTPVLVRRLEALDLVDRIVRLAGEAGVQRITKIQVRLDPSLDSRHGLDDVERTRVEVQMSTSSESITRFLASTQNERFGQPLTIEEYEIKGERNKLDAVKAELTFLVVRLHLPDGEEAE